MVSQELTGYGRVPSEPIHIGIQATDHKVSPKIVRISPTSQHYRNPRLRKNHLADIRWYAEPTVCKTATAADAG